MPYTEQDPLITISSLSRDLLTLGLRAGQTVIVHSSLKKIAGTGFVVGGPQAVIEALMRVLTPEGTLAMPTHNTDNTDPANWQYPPVPESWWETIRQEWPAYDPRRTPTVRMGAVPELFRTWPDVLRSGHPTASFAAWGRHAAQITGGNPLADDVGPGSPVAEVYALDGYVLLLGVGHHNNTSIHYAEHGAQWPGKAPFIENAAAHDAAGNRIRVDILHQSIDSADFDEVGAAYESAHPDAVIVGTVGAAVARFMRQRPLIDFAREWFSQNRPASLERAGKEP